MSLSVDPFVPEADIFVVFSDFSALLRGPGETSCVLQVLQHSEANRFFTWVRESSPHSHDASTLQSWESENDAVASFQLQFETKTKIPWSEKRQGSFEASAENFVFEGALMVPSAADLFLELRIAREEAAAATQLCQDRLSRLEAQHEQRIHELRRHYEQELLESENDFALYSRHQRATTVAAAAEARRCVDLQANLLALVDETLRKRVTHAEDLCLLARFFLHWACVARQGKNNKQLEHSLVEEVEFPLGESTLRRLEEEESSCLACNFAKLQQEQCGGKMSTLAAYFAMGWIPEQCIQWKEQYNKRLTIDELTILEETVRSPVKLCATKPRHSGPVQVYLPRFFSSNWKSCYAVLERTFLFLFSKYEPEAKSFSVTPLRCSAIKALSKDLQRHCLHLVSIGCAKCVGASEENGIEGVILAFRTEADKKKWAQEIHQASRCCPHQAAKQYNKDGVEALQQICEVLVPKQNEV